MAPPCALIILRQSARPRPVPGYSLACKRWNMPKIRLREPIAVVFELRAARLNRQTQIVDCPFEHLARLGPQVLVRVRADVNRSVIIAVIALNGAATPWPTAPRGTPQ